MRTAMKRAGAGLAVVGGIVLSRPGTHANKEVVRHQLDALGRHLRLTGGRLYGASYRLRHGRPGSRRGRQRCSPIGSDRRSDRWRSALTSPVANDTAPVQPSEPPLRTDSE